MSISIRILSALLVAMILTILPLPELLIGLRPPWVLLIVLYIQFYLPNYLNIVFLFLIGLCIDVLLASVIGEHAFTLVLTTWLASGKVRRFNFFPMGQQMALVCLFTLFYQLIILLIDAFLGYEYDLISTIGSALISMFIWPWLIILADGTLLAKRKILYK